MLCVCVWVCVSMEKETETQIKTVTYGERKTEKGRRGRHARRPCDLAAVHLTDFPRQFRACSPNGEINCT